MEPLRRQQLISGILFALVLILAYIAYRPGPEPLNNKVIQARYDSINREIKVITERDRRIVEQNANYKRLTDSLQTLKPITITKYVNIYKRVDNASDNAIHTAFDSIFTNNGIR